MSAWLDAAIHEALLGLAQDSRGKLSRRALEMWHREDSRGMFSHVRGSVAALARIDEERAPTDDELRAALTAALERDYGLR